ncbi:Endo-1,4-beta-xylanase [Handroanthus impetiginosus]|uniref:Endo-1,4-beta-xylanase n=1 Tax=Handroanthus impetiginosus TaxID=429701 RepID=A0A2G9HQG4_9LAMI|nr:Endo-1,4-beta-xylanase [Handroanthus impetiginosus]
MAMCLATPHRPQYDGGIVLNPELNDGLNGWSRFGDAKVEHIESQDGNKYIIASKRQQSFHSFTQKFNLEKEKLYTFSAWLQVSHGNADIAAIFKTQSGYETAGWVLAQKGCWSMLKGGLVVNSSGPVDLYFEFVKNFKILIVIFQILSDPKNRYSNEGARGVENYNIPDQLLRFTSSNGIAVRGHNVFWDDPRFQPSWVGGLSSNDLWAAANKRVSSVVGRYAGRLFHWDVVNENLHFNFFESKLGGSASTIFYQKTNTIDGRTVPFLNEYNTIEESRDGASSPARYLQKIQQLRQQGYRGPLGIGLEGHFSYANLPYIRSAIDTLASARLPIWVTELDVTAGPKQASYLEQILQEVHSHFAVQGIIIWAAWSPRGCYRMCLTDNNFRNLETGNVVDRIRRVWGSAPRGTTDSNGFFEASLFHGEYEVKIKHPNGEKISKLHKFNVVPEGDEPNTVQFKIDV